MPIFIWDERKILPLRSKCSFFILTVRWDIWGYPVALLIFG